MDELQQLLQEKRELERKIHALKTGSVSNEMAKVDRIGFAGKYQMGKWALFYKYMFIVNKGPYPGRPILSSKWQPLCNGESFDDVIGQIPNVVKTLTELYEKARGKKNGTDT